MDSKTAKTKKKDNNKTVCYEMHATTQREVQQELEKRRPKGVLIDQLPIINSCEMQMRVNQFKFVQKDIRPLPEDSAWLSAVYLLYSSARRRIVQQLVEREKLGKHDADVYPFRLRFVGEIKGVKTIIASEKPAEIKSDQEFESRLKEVLNKCREFLAALSQEEDQMLFDFELTMQTIEYSYAHENVHRLD